MNGSLAKIVGNHTGALRRVRVAAVCLAVVLAASALVTAQTKVDTVSSLPGIEVTTSVDRADMLIGDLITYRLTITYDSTYELIPPPLGANLGAFDVKDYQPDLISKLDDGRLQSDNTFKLSTFTTGNYVIPPIPVMFVLPDSSRKVVLSESVPIKVNSLLENEGDSVDIRDLKDPYEFRRDLTAYYAWGAAIAALLLIGGLLLWRRLRRTADIAAPVDTRPPWEIAFEKLALLREDTTLKEGLFKPYYVSLTEIARQYLGRMYGVDVLEMTTEEFLDRFAGISMPDGTYEACRDFLTHADLVKFARYTPERGRAEADIDLVHDIVEAVRAQYQARMQRTAEAGDARQVVGAGSGGTDEH